MTSARPFSESEKLAQAADEFPMRLNACAEAWGEHTEHIQRMRILNFVNNG